jgi:hypothetical protein
MKRIVMTLAVAAVAALAGSAYGTPLLMEYEITDLGGGLYDYEFYFTLDNHDGTWQSGNGWAWVIIGDAQNQSSPLYDWAGDNGDFPVGPWTYWTSSGGYHNGPTLGYVLDYWYPQKVGEQLYFSGTSTVYLKQGEMLWSSIVTTGGAQIVEWEVAQLIPTPGALALLALGGLASRRRRR